jgi:hypothetical protein
VAASSSRLLAIGPKADVTDRFRDGVCQRANWTAEGMRNKSYAFKRLREDLQALGFRHRRAHDLRRTMISLSRDDGARKDILELCTSVITSKAAIRDRVKTGHTRSGRDQVI